MDFIYNAMMASVKTSQERPAQTTDKKSDSDGFQKLLDQKQSGDNNAAVSGQEQPQQAQGTQPQEAEAVQPVQDPRELEKRMALAASVMAQNPEVAELVADIAEETPQVLTDPNWDDGFIPVGYDDYNGYRVVHWMNPEAANENLQELNEQAGKWLEQQGQAEEAAPETVVKDSILPKLAEAAPKAEIRTENAVEIPVEDVEQLPEEAPVETPVFEDVTHVPVKVAEAPAEQPTEESASVAQQVQKGLFDVLETYNPADGSRTITIQLTPENLGRVEIDMSFNKDGSLHVLMTAENSRTASLLSRHSGELAGLLGKFVEQDVRVEVPQQENQQRQELYDQQNRQNQQQQQKKQGRKESSEDFLHQLRLGLVPLDGE